jgi:hypothetical protein
VVKWINTPACVVVIRGHRRSGKSSTVKKIARQFNKKIIELFVSSDTNDFLKTSIIIFGTIGIQVRGAFEIGLAAVEAVKKGYIVIIEEMQNASQFVQLSLQQGIDNMAFKYMMYSSEWSTAGALFLMGSLPDSMVESRIGALFQRITAKITVLPLDTLEMAILFNKFDITDTSLMLSLHTIFGGKPFPYEIACKAKLLNGNNANIAVVIKQFFASELQSNFEDAADHLAKQLEKEYSLALKAVKQKTNKSEQEAKLNSDLKTNDAYHILYQDLYLRYGVIEPCYSVTNFKSIIKYDVTDPLSLLAMNGTCGSVRREDVLRDVCITDKALFELEGFHLERWIKEIAEDRRLLLNIASFPIPEVDLKKCVFTPKLVWDIKDCEIDFIGSVLESNLLLLGSCKRNVEHVDHENLLAHLEKLKTLKNTTPYSTTWLSTLKLQLMRFLCTSFLKLHLRNYNPSHNITDQIKKYTWLITLKSMLEPFCVKAKDMNIQCINNKKESIFALKKDRFFWILLIPSVMFVYGMFMTF